MEVQMTNPKTTLKCLEEVKFPVSLPEVTATEISEIWSHWEIQQALADGDLDRAADLAQLAEDTIWF